MARYKIIDEPTTKPWGENFVVDPIIILLAAILVPLLWNPPALGRFWLPLVWLILNGYALGSSTLGREIGYMALGIVGWYAVLRITSAIIGTGYVTLPVADVYDYVIIAQFGIFFLTMYLVVFKQSQSYHLFRYIRGDDR